MLVVEGKCENCKKTFDYFSNNSRCPHCYYQNESWNDMLLKMQHVKTTPLSKDEFDKLKNKYSK